MPPPYEDKTLPTYEWCDCGKKNLWNLTEVNVKWHLHGKGGPGGGCSAYRIAVHPFTSHLFVTLCLCDAAVAYFECNRCPIASV